MKHGGHATFPRILPVILAGGVGARLAPISTDARPKPFLPTADGHSLLTHTLQRVADAAHFLPPVLIGRAVDRFALLNHARAAGVLPSAILLEEAPRNTGMAVAAAVAWAERHQPEALLAILPADHQIATPLDWLSSLRAAGQASTAQRKLCLLAAAARIASPDYGYILGDPSANGVACAVAAFVEKPADPQSLIARGGQWNMGQFVAPVAVLRDLLQAHAPAMLEAARAGLAQSEPSFEFTPLAAWPDRLPATPFDRAVVEKSACLAVPYSGDWHDLGTLPAWEMATGLSGAFYADLPPRTDRPWGYFELLEAFPDRLRKRLVIYPGCRLSRQRHQHRSERWVVQQGTAHIEKGEEIHRLNPGKSITIPRQCWHRLSNHHVELLIIEEIQHGKPDESDIEREEDDYGRL